MNAILRAVSQTVQSFLCIDNNYSFNKELIIKRNPNAFSYRIDLNKSSNSLRMLESFNVVRNALLN